MKQKTIFLFVLSLWTGVFTANANFELEVEGINYSLLGYADNSTASVIGKNTHCTENIVIPPSVPYNSYDYKVVSIDSEAFADCVDLTSITLPESLKSIEYRAFSGCTGLMSLTLPKGLLGIGNYAFDPAVSRYGVAAAPRIVEHAGNQIVLIGCCS